MCAVLGMVALLFLSCACTRAGSDCPAQIHALRDRTAAIDWSTVGLYANVAYTDIPVGDGLPTSGTSRDNIRWSAPVVVDGSVVWYANRSHESDAALDRWLLTEAKMYQEFRGSWPNYALATNRTRVGLIRRVEKILRPLGGIRLAVRPATVVEPWPARTDRNAFYMHATRTVPPPEDRERDEGLRKSVLVAARGCPEAVRFLDRGMSLGERLLRVSDPFETCSCKGDMDTMAALLWFMALHDQVPIRWHPWDEELVRSLGDDATYGELAKVLTQKYLAAGKP